MLCTVHLVIFATYRSYPSQVLDLPPRSQIEPVEHLRPYDAPEEAQHVRRGLSIHREPLHRCFATRIVELSWEKQ